MSKLVAGTGWTGQHFLMRIADGPQITTLKNSLSSVHMFDGLRCNILDNTQLADCKTIVQAMPNLRFWRYVNPLEYPFCASAGQSENALKNWIRSNVQFDGAGDTNQRMLVSGTPDTVGLFYAYYVGPSDLGHNWVGYSDEYEYQELWHWNGIGSTLADSIVSTFIDYANLDDVAPHGGLFIDQAWLRIFDWQIQNGDPAHPPWAGIDWKSGHGDTEEEDPELGGAIYDDLESAYAGGVGGTWPTYRSNIQYFYQEADAAAAAVGTWNIKNGDMRQGSALNGGETIPGPYYFEFPYSNPLMSIGNPSTPGTIWYLWATIPRCVFEVVSIYVENSTYWNTIKANFETYGGWMCIVPGGEDGSGSERETDNLMRAWSELGAIRAGI